MSGQAEQRVLEYDPKPERIDWSDRLEVEALAFHQANPHILREIVRICLLVHSKGRRRWSMKGAFEVVRYNHDITTTGKTYKLSNNHTAYYARWVARDFPELKDFFLMKRVRSDD